METEFSLGLALAAASGLLQGTLLLPMKLVRTWKWGNLGLAPTSWGAAVSRVHSRCARRVAPRYTGLSAALLAKSAMEKALRAWSLTVRALRPCLHTATFTSPPERPAAAGFSSPNTAPRRRRRIRYSIVASGHSTFVAVSAASTVCGPSSRRVADLAKGTRDTRRRAANVGSDKKVRKLLLPPLTRCGGHPIICFSVKLKRFSSNTQLDAASAWTWLLRVFSN